MITTTLDPLAIEGLLPGQHIILLSDTPTASIQGRRLGLEVRDTILIKSTGPQRFAFLFRKPCSEPTVVAQVLKTGTGALWIDGCQIGAGGTRLEQAKWATTGGRCPPNVVFVHDPRCDIRGVQCHHECPLSALKPSATQFFPQFATNDDMLAWLKSLIGDDVKNEILHGDSLEAIKTFEDASIDATVTDPPYGLGTREPTEAEIDAYLTGDARLDTGGDLMGYEWEIPPVALWREVYRVMKPGAVLMSFAGSRTLDLMAAGIETAGFTYLGLLEWAYGTGFTKSFDIAKAVDRRNGQWRGRAGKVLSENASMSAPNYERTPKGDPITQEAETWDGWGTALKPAWEPVLVFSKGETGFKMPASADTLRYCAKPSKKEKSVDGEVHPTSKPIEVMEWLVNLASQPGQLVFDPYLGSGTTAVACVKTGRAYVGIERDGDFFKLARKRLGLITKDKVVQAGQESITLDAFDMEPEDCSPKKL